MIDGTEVIIEGKDACDDGGGLRGSPANRILDTMDQKKWKKK
jgi:hypothetical protein